MGTLTKSSSHIGQWLDRIDSIRSELISTAASGNRVASAFAMADARVELFETLKNEQIQAKLLRMTDPEVCMVELANNPTRDDRVRICAIAILSGFTPGDDQFAIFGGGRNKDGSAKPGKLYTKEAGFRKLFAHLGIVPEVKTEHPEWVEFGSSGKKCWRVGGSASCTYNGEDYSIEMTGDNRLGIPGYESDNVAGVAAKARRRLLQALWSMVSPILTAEHSDDDQDIPVQAQSDSPLLTQGQPPADQWDQTRERVISRLNDPSQIEAFKGLWYSIADAQSEEDLDAVAEEIKGAKTLFQERDVEELRRLWKHVSEGMRE